jgi:murein DD-endopeptidase MepM/ murein hydrolase activator NlpD
MSTAMTTQQRLFTALLALALALAAGCSSGSNDEDALQVATATRPATASPTIKPTRPATATAEPTGAPTPSPASPEPSAIPPVDTPAAEPPAPGPTPVDASQIQLLPTDIGQGQVSTIRLWGYGASSAMATLNERRYPLVADGGFFWGILAASADQPPGVYPVAVQLRQENGDLLSELSTQINVVAMGYPVENIDLPPESTALLTPELVQEEQNIRDSVFALFTPQKLWVGAFIIPVNAAIVSPYGIGRSYNGGPVSGYHTGVDLAGEEGDWVTAANSGRVAFVRATPLRGNGVIIDHGAGVFSGYYHLSAIAVQEGQMVNKGDLVGAVGSTGMVTGPHLHWEIIVRGVVIDPIPWTLEAKGP